MSTTLSPPAQSNQCGNPPERTPSGRILELDAIRGIAAVAVLLYHLPRGLWYGATGVDLFFVLSGYLITGIILGNIGRPNFLLTFYWRRSLRIFPIYYLAIAFMLVVNNMRGHPGPIDGVWHYLTYTQNLPMYWGGVTPPTELSLGHTWTLAIEEQFYLFWPVVIVLLGVRRLTLLAVFFLLVPIILRSFGLSRVVLFGHTDGLALGALLAYLGSHYRGRFRLRFARWFLLVFTASGGLYAFCWWQSCVNGSQTGEHFLASNLPITLISLCYFGLVGLVECYRGSRWLAALRNPALIQIGNLSYGLYLYHWIVYECLDTYFKFQLGYADPWWLDVMKVMTSFAIAWLSWHLIEKPLLSVKDRFSYGARPSLA